MIGGNTRKKERKKKSKYDDDEDNKNGDEENRQRKTIFNKTTNALFSLISLSLGFRKMETEATILSN